MQIRKERVFFFYKMNFQHQPLFIAEDKTRPPVPNFVYSTSKQKWPTSPLTNIKPQSPAYAPPGLTLQMTDTQFANTLFIPRNSYSQQRFFPYTTLTNQFSKQGTLRSLLGTKWIFAGYKMKIGFSLNVTHSRCVKLTGVKL
jgi:hypothetical protein